MEESTEGVRLRPHFALANAFSIRAYTALNRFDEAKATYAQALERKLHTSYIDAAMYSWHSRRTIGRRWSNTLQRCLYRSGSTRCWVWKAILPPIQGALETPASLAAAMDRAQRAGEKDAPALYSGTSALREVWFGNTGEARRRATLALKLSSGRDLQYFAALVFAYSKDDARAKVLADDLNKRFPEDTIVQFNYLPSLRGRLALNKGYASGAIQVLRIAAPYELGETRAIDLDWTAMFPVFCAW